MHTDRIHSPRAVLCLLLALAVLFRLLPLNYGAPGPGYFSADEIDSVSRALKMAQGDLLPLHANKPTLYPGTLAIVYGAEFLVGKAFAGWSIDDYQRRFFTRPFAFYRGARLVSIAASCAAVAIVLLALRRRGYAALLAGLLVIGFARSSIFYGHIAKEDALAAMWTAAAFVLALNSSSSGGKLRSPTAMLLLSGLCAGLAVSTKYNCFFAPLFPALALLRLPDPGRRKLLLLFALIAVGALGFFAGTPYALLHPVQFTQRTLSSPIASQVAGALNNVNYIDRHGPVFLAKMLWREHGPLLVPIALAIAYVLRNCKKPSPDSSFSPLLLIPAAIYLLVLAFSSQLDYQYLLPLTPILAIITGHAALPLRASEPPREPDPRPLSRPYLLLLCALGAAFQGFFLLRATAEYLGQDTRLEAAEWLDSTGAISAQKPFLIVSPYYFHYYPLLNFDAGTYERLMEEARRSGAEGGYFERARHYAAESGDGDAVPADFLDVRVGYRNLPEGGRQFEPQPFALGLDEYRGRYSFVIIPENSLVLQGRSEPELAAYQRFLTEIQRLPLAAEFHPRPWRGGGPSLWVYRMEVSDEQPDFTEQ